MSIVWKIIETDIKVDDCPQYTLERDDLQCMSGFYMPLYNRMIKGIKRGDFFQEYSNRRVGGSRVITVTYEYLMIDEAKDSAFRRCSDVESDYLDSVFP